MLRGLLVLAYHNIMAPRWLPAGPTQFSEFTPTSSYRSVHAERARERAGRMGPTLALSEGMHSR